MSTTDYSTGFAVLRFHAEWCMPCRRLETIVGKMTAEFPEISIYNIDIDKDYDIAKNFSIKSVPTLVMLKEGKEKDRIIGVVKTEDVRKAFRTFLKAK